MKNGVDGPVTPSDDGIQYVDIPDPATNNSVHSNALQTTNNSVHSNALQTTNNSVYTGEDAEGVHLMYNNDGSMYFQATAANGQKHKLDNISRKYIKYKKKYLLLKNK
jgi:hypothetical protein